MRSIYKKLDDLVRKWTRLRYKRCLFCGNPNIETCHIFARSNLSLRWDTDNIVPLCRKCHTWFDTHKNEGLEMLKKIWGEERIDKLEKKAYRAEPLDTDLHALAHNLKEKIKMLEGR